MRRTEQLTHIIVVVGVLVGVTHDEADGASRRLALKHTTQQFHLILLLSACRDAALSWTAPVKLRLDECQVNSDACRHAVDNAANSLPVALAKRRQSE